MLVKNCLDTSIKAIRIVLINLTFFLKKFGKPMIAVSTRKIATNDEEQKLESPSTRNDNEFSGIASYQLLLVYVFYVLTIFTISILNFRKPVSPPKQNRRSNQKKEENLKTPFGGGIHQMANYNIHFCKDKKYQK